MKTTDLEHYYSFVDYKSETFEVEFSHPTLDYVHFLGEFSNLNIEINHCTGDYFTPPDTETLVDFEIDMDTLKIYDGEGYLITGVNKDIIELLEDYIEDYIYENAGELLTD
jgi:hypothetical protein